MKRLMILTALIGSTMMAAGCKQATELYGINSDKSGFPSFAKDRDLSDEEVASLIHMRQEEKLARDVYLTLYQRWGLSIFNNIAASEQRHTDAVRGLLETYGIPDPITNDSIGYFQDPEMTQLFNALVEQGNRSLLDALVVGATIEDLDIYDLDELLDSVAFNPYVRQVYSNLVRSSENHMRAFYRQIVDMGGTYTPQYISQERFDEIISGSNGGGGGRRGGGR